MQSPLAVLTTETFDAAIVDPDTIQLAGALAEHWALEDVDGDGDLDLVLHFRVADTNLQQVYAQLLQDELHQDGSLDSTRKSANISLSGETTSGEQLIGADVVDLFYSGRALRDFLDEVFDGV